MKKLKFGKTFKTTEFRDFNDRPYSADDSLDSFHVAVLALANESISLAKRMLQGGVITSDAIARVKKVCEAIEREHAAPARNPMPATSAV